MREIQQIAEGAFWVKPYSEQTVINVVPGYTNQAIIVSLYNVTSPDVNQDLIWEEIFEDIIDERKEAWEILSDH